MKNVIEHIKTCLTINGKQNLKLKSSSIKFRNHFKQLAVPFKIYPDFECHIKRAKSNDKNNASCTENVKIMFLAGLLIKLCALMIDIASELFFTEEKTQFID